MHVSSFLTIRGDAGSVGPPNMDEKAEQHESDQHELVTQQVRRHEAVLFHGDERGQFYSIRSLPNYPLHEGTRPSATERQRCASQPDVTRYDSLIQ